MEHFVQFQNYVLNIVYNTYGYKNIPTIPLIYVLMANQTTNSYKEMVQVLKNNNPNLNPYSIIINFEK